MHSNKKKNDMKMKPGLLILSGGKNVQACGNIVIFPHCGRRVISNALIFFLPSHTFLILFDTVGSRAKCTALSQV